MLGPFWAQSPMLMHRPQALSGHEYLFWQSLVQTHPINSLLSRWSWRVLLKERIVLFWRVVWLWLLGEKARTFMKVVDLRIRRWDPEIQKTLCLWEFFLHNHLRGSGLCAWKKMQFPYTFIKSWPWILEDNKRQGQGLLFSTWLVLSKYLLMMKHSWLS